MSHPSIPAGDARSVFQTERWDRRRRGACSGPSRSRQAPIEVRLYFAEICFTSPGARSFDVSVEGNLVLNDYDIVADVGAFAGVMKSFVVSADADV